MIQEVPEQFEEARRTLKHARMARSIADVGLCRKMAQKAYDLANAVGDGETMYQSRACVGRMHRYRAEHEEAYMAYRSALREAESNRLAEWLGPAHHDCFVEAMQLNDKGTASPHAVVRMDIWRDSPSGLFAFVQDLSYLRLLRRETDARFLYQTAAQAAFYAQNPFERMVLFASQAFAAGTLQHERWYEASRRRFDYAVDKLAGAEEGVALQMLDVARGAEMMGRRGEAMDYAASARHIASRRREPIVQDRADEIMVRLGVVQVHGLTLDNQLEEQVTDDLPHL